MSRLGPSLAATLAALFGVACGGADTPEDPLPVCYLNHPVPDGGMVHNLRAEEWADLVVRGYREGAESAQNCVGTAFAGDRPTTPVRSTSPTTSRPPARSPSPKSL